MHSRGPYHAAAADAGLANVRIVLVRPRGSANVGAAARAMKNMGIGELTLVQPAVRRYAVAEAMAVHARDLVRGARKVADLGAAVGDCRLVVGTTCRLGGYRTAVEDVDTLAPLMLAAAAQGPVAVLFGPEDHGLTNQDLRHCQRLVTIDTSAAYASLNLAQAVLLVCAALRRALRTVAPPASIGTPAPAGAVQRMYEHLQRALLAIGFLHPQNPEHLMFALRRMFGRGGLEEHEVRILLGIAHQIEWFARKDVTGDRLPVTGTEACESVAGGASRLDASSAALEHSADHRSPVTGHRSRISSSDSRETGRRSRLLRHG